MRNFIWSFVFIFYSVWADESCLCIFACNTNQKTSPNYYDTLNEYLQKHESEIKSIDMSSSQEDLRKAYLNLSRKLHPDRNQTPGATEQFQDLSTIYETLKDEKSRRVYNASLQPTLLKRMLSCFFCHVSLFTSCESKFD
jgi:hypothetical protein